MKSGVKRSEVLKSMCVCAFVRLCVHACARMRIGVDGMG